jgi:hypothetical protein
MKDVFAWVLAGAKLRVISKFGSEAEVIGQELARDLERQARREVDLVTAQVDLLELRSALRRLEARVGIDPQPNTTEAGEEARDEVLPRQIGAEDPVERFRAECLRMHDEAEELWRKRRALDAINPIGGLTEERWREFEAQRAEMRRRLVTAGLSSDDEAAPA